MQKDPKLKLFLKMEEMHREQTAEGFQTAQTWLKVKSINTKIKIEDFACGPLQCLIVCKVTTVNGKSLHICGNWTGAYSSTSV